MENSANRANYDELGDHIKLLSTRGKEGNLTAAQVEDLEDYYERALQMRVMQNTTLESQLKEEKDLNNKKTKQLANIYVGLNAGLVCLFATITYLLSLKWPAIVLPILETGLAFFCRPPVLIICTYVVTKYMR